MASAAAPEPHQTEVLERRGESETTFSALCLTCGWRSEDGRYRSDVERRAEMHRNGEVPIWADASLSPGWDGVNRDLRY